MNISGPLLSICCITYNHAKYIGDAIEGFLRQKTAFPIEIIIHDDASTDGTADIIKVYENRHPELIRSINQKENQFSLGRKPWSEFVFPKCRGKYIAICEGDDCWTDPYKLQKQVMHLENNQGCALVHTNCIVRDEGANSSYVRHKNALRQSVGTKVVILSNKIATCTTMFRKELIADFDNLPREIQTDRWLWLFLSTKGSIDYLDEVTAVYNLHEGGIYSGRRNYLRVSDRTKSILVAKEVFPAYQRLFNALILSEGTIGLLGSIKHLDLGAASYLLRVLVDPQNWSCELKMLFRQNRSNLWFAG